LHATALWFGWSSRQPQRIDEFLDRHAPAKVWIDKSAQD